MRNRIFALLSLLSLSSCSLALSLRASDDIPRAIRIISTNKNGGRSHTFIVNPRNEKVHNEPVSDSPSKQLKRSSWSVIGLLENLQSGFRSTFLPAGFPSKTPDGYLKYAVWSWIQDLSTQLRGVLATQRILEGVGVGREGATALSALLNFLVRDASGMLASLVFTASAAPLFRTDVKRWRLLADIMVDIGITLEVAAIQVPPAFFLPMISVGNMCKAICGVAAGACSGPINLHWAKGSDISDISAKFGAQNTVTGSLGIVFAAIFAKSVASLPLTPLWILYGTLTFLHIVANRRCMRLMAFDSFSTLRMDIVVSDFLSHYNDASTVDLPRPLTPLDVSSREPLLFTTPQPWKPQHRIEMGVSFNEFVDLTTNDDMEMDGLLADGPKEYWLGTTTTFQSPQIVVALSENITKQNTAKAYFHARLLDRCLSMHTGMDPLEAKTLAGSQLEQAWTAFRQQSQESGWDFVEAELKTKGYEVALAPL
jgi:hypothetical protein